MNKSFLDHYERELEHLRSTARVFAREHEQVAGRLSLDVEPCPDPHVERLLEGVAFLAARVQERIEAGYPKFIETLFNSIYPHYLPPTPAMTVVQFEAPAAGADAFKEGQLIPAGTDLSTMPVTDFGGRCSFRTAHAITVWPIRVKSATYHGADVGALALPRALTGDKTPAAAIRVELECPAGMTFADMAPNHLDFHLGWGNESSHRLHELLMIGSRPPILRWEGARGSMEHAQDPALHRVEPLGFSREDALLPVDRRCFDGYRLLHEYFSFPARFMFARFAGLKSACSKCDCSVMELVVPLDAEDEWLEEHPDLSKQFLPGCTPAINLFRPDSIDSVAVTPGRYEYRVVADASRQMDYEIFSIDRVTGSDRRTRAAREFAPFYSTSDPRRGGSSLAGYFSTHRRLTARSEFEVASGRDGAAYLGSDLYITLTDVNGEAALPDVASLSIDGLCTNRDLPLELWRTRGENAFEGGRSVAQCRIRCLRPPTTPRPAIAQGEAAWRLVSHLGLNFHPLLDAEGDGEVSADALRDLCRLFADRDATSGEVRGRRLETAARQADSIKSIRVRTVSGPLPRQGRLSIVRGIEIEVTLDERAFHGASVFLFASVLEQFFARYVSINSFANMVLRTVQRGEVHRWPSRIGRRPTC